MKCLNNLLQLQTRNDMFKVISDIRHIAMICKIQLTTFVINFLLLFPSMQGIIGDNKQFLWNKMS